MYVNTSTQVSRDDKERGILDITAAAAAAAATSPTTDNAVSVIPHH